MKHIDIESDNDSAVRKKKSAFKNVYRSKDSMLSDGLSPARTIISDYSDGVN